MQKQISPESQQVKNIQPELVELEEKEKEISETFLQKKKASPKIFLLIFLFFALTLAGYFTYYSYFSNNKSKPQEHLSEEVEKLNPSISPETEEEIISEYDDLFKDVEIILADLNGLPTEQIDDNAMWWVSMDGFSILNSNSAGIVGGVSCRTSSYEEGLKIVQEMKEKIGPAIDELMLDQGYKVNNNNSSVSYEDDSFYDYIQGYENDDTKCLLTISPDCSGGIGHSMGYAATFSCTSDFESNYSSQAPILEDLQLFGQVISNVKMVDNFFTASVNGRRSGYIIIAKKINNKWVKVHGGHDGPTCDVVDKYEIPNEFVSNCWDVELNETRENKFGL